jgi:hypothetical protein
VLEAARSRRDAPHPAAATHGCEPCSSVHLPTHTVGMASRQAALQAGTSVGGEAGSEAEHSAALSARAPASQGAGAGRRRELAAMQLVSS